MTTKFSPGEKVWISRDVGMRDIGPCKSCNGKGSLPDLKGKRIPCGACSGRGRIIRHGNWRVVDTNSTTINVIELRASANDTNEFVFVEPLIPGHGYERVHSSDAFRTKKEAQQKCKERNKKRMP